MKYFLSEFVGYSVIIQKFPMDDTIQRIKQRKSRLVILNKKVFKPKWLEDFFRLFRFLIFSIHFNRFEIFETLLSYFSNTLSFVRIGAFAVSHAAMMEVVLMLAGAESGSPNWIVVVLGNLFVCGMEGLIVGIQVLRLEYYEMFSRFYKGSGRAFDPYTKTQTTKKKRS